MMSYQIMRALELMESLDSSFKIGPPKNIPITQQHKDVGITEHTEYDLDGGDAGTMTIYRRNGAIEVHHHIPNGDGEIVSGEFLPDGKHNAKFVGTMYRVAKRILETGHLLRVVGNHTNKMFDHYNRMANVLAKRHGYIVSHPEIYKHPSENAKDYSEITISKPAKNWSPSTNLNESISRSRSKFNNYGLDNSQYWVENSIRDTSISHILKDI